MSCRRFAILVGAVLLVPLSAAAEWRRVAPLSRQQATELRQSLQSESAFRERFWAVVPRIRVPAASRRHLLCRLGTVYFECEAGARGDQCPAFLTLGGDQGLAFDVPVACVGPTDEAQCDCVPLNG